MEHNQDLQRLIELQARLLTLPDQPELYMAAMSEYHTLFDTVVEKHLPLVQQMATAGLFSVAFSRNSGDVGDYLREPYTYALFSCDRVENAKTICLYAAFAAHSEPERGTSDRYEHPDADSVGQHMDEVIRSLTDEAQRAWTLEEILPFVLDDQYETIWLSENPQPDGSQAYVVTCDCQDGDNMFSEELTEELFCKLITNLVQRPELHMRYHIERSSDYVAGEDTSPIRYHSFHSA